MTLQPNTEYAVVVDVGSAFVSFEFTADNGQTSAHGWTIADVSQFTSPGGTRWVDLSNALRITLKGKVDNSIQQALFARDLAQAFTTGSGQTTTSSPAWSWVCTLTVSTARPPTGLRRRLQCAAVRPQGRCWPPCSSIPGSTKRVRPWARRSSAPQRTSNWIQAPPTGSPPKAEGSPGTRHPPIARTRPASRAGASPTPANLGLTMRPETMSRPVPLPSSSRFPATTRRMSPPSALRPLLAPRLAPL